jgi:hypothetical protein
MPVLRRMRVGIRAVAPALLLIPAVAAAQAARTAAAERSGQHDFDFELGTWATDVRVLRNPLTGAPPEWASYRGTSVVRPIMDRRANLVEFSVAGAAGRIEGVSLRLYNPQTRQWSLNFAGLRDGMLTAPVYGAFDPGGRGTFHGQDMIDGRAALVRFVITRASAKEARFEQAYSVDGGKSWEINWIAIDRLQ